MALSTLVFSFSLSSGHHALISVIVLKIIVVDEAILVGLFQPVFVLQKLQANQRGSKATTTVGQKKLLLL
jgi:hypothetical protein